MAWVRDWPRTAAKDGRTAAKDGRTTAIICTISCATQRISLILQIGKWDVILRKKPFILCVDQLWCRQNYSESCMIRELTMHERQAIRGCRGMAGSIDGPGHLWMLRNGRRAIRGSPTSYINCLTIVKS